MDLDRVEHPRVLSTVRIARDGVLLLEAGAASAGCGRCGSSITEFHITAAGLAETSCAGPRDEVSPAAVRAGDGVA